MNSRERFLTALNGGVPDMVPIEEHLFSLKLQKEILGYNTELYDGATQTKLAAKLRIDMVWIPINGFWELKKYQIKKMNYTKMNGGNLQKKTVGQLLLR